MISQYVGTHPLVRVPVGLRRMPLKEIKMMKALSVDFFRVRAEAKM